MPALLAGMMPWESQLRVALPGYQFYCREPGSAMKSWDRWDGKEAGEWAGSQKASVIRADYTDLSLQNFAGLAFFWWKIFVYIFWGMVPLLNKEHLPCRAGFVSSLSVLLGAGLQGQGGLLPWDSIEVSDMDSSGKGTWHPPLRPWECSPGNRGSHSISRV